MHTLIYYTVIHPASIYIVGYYPLRSRDITFGLKKKRRNLEEEMDKVARSGGLTGTSWEELPSFPAMILRGWSGKDRGPFRFVSLIHHACYMYGSLAPPHIMTTTQQKTGNYCISEKGMPALCFICFIKHAL